MRERERERERRKRRTYREENFGARDRNISVAKF
jgi:hypothetical protein